jgi:putative glutamine amidotransferase
MAHDPIIGITCNVNEREAMQRRTYARAVLAAGGVPVLLPPPGPEAEVPAHRLATLARAHLRAIDGLILTGGDDPDLTRYGLPNHPASTLLHPDRQRYEEALLLALDEAARLPALGICLGMQMMSLHAGGRLDPHLPDTTPTHAQHAGDTVHPVVPDVPHPVITPGGGASWHHQAVRQPGSLRIVARAPDGVIEAVDNPARPFYLGVQWHPERTSDDALGPGVFRALIEAARAAREHRSVT